MENTSMQPSRKLNQSELSFQFKPFAATVVMNFRKESRETYKREKGNTTRTIK